MLGGGDARMSAQARPVSNTWEGADDGYAEEEVFQPENFMYLGPGVYTDISPLIEEEEEAARRTIAGDVGVSRVTSKAGSPAVSQKTMPMIAGSEVSPPAIQATTTLVPELAAAAAAAPEPAPVAPAPVEIEDTPQIHMLDGREMPHELPAGEIHPSNPVGFVAELPTEHTAMARAETHPPAVEIGDNSILAPVEVALAAGLADEQKRAGQMEEEKFREPTETVHRGNQSELTEVVPLAKIEEKASNAQYQPYTPGQASPSDQTILQPPSSKRVSTQRGPSLMMKAGSRDTEVDPESVPTALAPRRHSQSTSQPSSSDETTLEANTDLGETEKASNEGSAVVPLSLQASRIEGKGEMAQTAAVVTPPASGSEAASPPKNVAVSKVPSVLKPARGRIPTQSAASAPAVPSGDAVVDMPPALKSYQIPSQDPRTTGVGSTTWQSAVQAPATQPLMTHQEQQLARPTAAFATQRRPSVPGPSPVGLPDAAPSPAMPSHVAAIPRSASTPAVVAPLKLERQVLRKPLPEAPASSPGGRVMVGSGFWQPDYSPSGSVPEPEFSEMKNRPTPSSSASDTVSPLMSRSSRSDSAPVQSPSPLDFPLKRHAPSQVTLNQSVGSDTIFTPSPLSTTPGSGGQPTRRPSSALRHSISGPIPGPSTPSQAPPPVPSKIPLELESYFPLQDSSQIDRLAQSPGPTGPSKEMEARHQRSSSQPQSPPPGGRDDPASIYALGRIDEGREEATVTQPANVQMNPAMLERRHSTASSIQPSRPQTVSSISSVEHMRSFSPETRISALSSTSDRAHVSSPTRPPPQGQFLPQGQFPIQSQFLPQGHMSLHGQFPPQGQFPPHGQLSPQGQMSSYGQFPPQGVDPRQAGFPSQYQPPNRQQPGIHIPHRHQTWHAQAAPQMAQGPPSHHPAGQGHPISKDKEKEKKWTKWFKGQKGATLSKVPPGPISPPLVGHPSQPGLSNPNLGQMPAGGLQGMPNPNVQQVRVPSGPSEVPYPQAGPAHGGMASSQWPPAYSPSNFNTQQGMQPQVPHAQPRLAGPQSAGLHHRGQPGPGPQKHMNPIPSGPPALTQTQTQARPQAPMQGRNPIQFNHPVVHPRDALGSHPSSSIPPPGANSASAERHNYRTSIVSPQTSWGEEARVSAGSNAPNTPGHKPTYAQEMDKWAERPVADYSGGGWGRDGG